MRMYAESLVYALMTIISGLYHYLDQTRTACLIHNHMCLPTLHFLDFVYAYSMIALTVGIWLHPFTTSMSIEQIYRNCLYRNVVTTVATVFVLFAIKDDLDMPKMIGILGGGLFLYGLVMIFIVRVDIRVMNWWYLPFALSFYACGLACFFLQERTYWVVHSFWHIFVAIGMGVTILMRLHVRDGSFTSIPLDNSAIEDDQLIMLV